ncbi:D-alanyl-D-alanine carboxypeptidase family protein, partial [Streptococcus suis]
DWHFRYVGKKSAEYMTKHNLTLEEYVALLEERDA